MATASLAGSLLQPNVITDLPGGCCCCCCCVSTRTVRIKLPIITLMHLTGCNAQYIFIIFQLPCLSTGAHFVIRYLSFGNNISVIPDNPFNISFIALAYRHIISVKHSSSSFILFPFHFMLKQTTINQIFFPYVITMASWIRAVFAMGRGV